MTSQSLVRCITRRDPGVSSCLIPRKEFVRGESSDDKEKRVYWKGRPGRKPQGEETGGLFCHVAHSLSGLTVTGLPSFGVASGRSSCLCPYLVQLRVLPDSTHLSDKMVSCMRFLGNWWDILWAGISSLLSAPPKFSWLVLGGSTVFPIKTAFCETARA